MGFRINTNTTSLAAQRSLGRTNKAQQNTLIKLSTGSRITKSADDAAGLAISEKLKATIRSSRQADRNANDGISLVQTAEGGLEEISNILIRLRELAIQSASDTVTDADRKFTNLEYQNLKEEVNRISQSTEFNGHKLLNGTSEVFEFQVGTNNSPFEDRISYDSQLVNSTLDGINLAEVGVSNKESSQLSLTKIDTAMENISGMRATLGAVQNRLVSTSNNLLMKEENLSAANSRMRDADYAKLTAVNTGLNIRNQAGTAVLAQANSQPMAALKLLSF